jgi:hypothetical protein
MAKRTLDLHKIEVEKHLRRATSGTDGPVGIQWFADVRFAEPHWYRDRERVRWLVDTLAAASWFAEFDVFAPGHRAGVALRIDDVRDAAASGDEATAIFAHGGPRMTVDIPDADAALALDIIRGRLELRAWFGTRVVTQYKGALLGDVIDLLVAVRDQWPAALIAKATASPDPSDGLRYPRTRPMRLAGRPLSSVVDVLDRAAAGNGPGWPRETTAMIDAALPSPVAHTEHGSVVVMRWIEDPSDWRAFADACSRHEQWLLSVLPSQLAPGWNEQGDVEIVDDPKTLDVLDVASLPKRAHPGVTLVAGSREHALALVQRVKAAGFARVAYRDESGRLWDPDPPGSWLTGTT